MPTCYDCKFCGYTEVTINKRKDMTEKISICRFNPPSTEFPYKLTKIVKIVQLLWPPVNPMEDWCGEFSRPGTSTKGQIS